MHPADVLREIVDLGQLPLQPAYTAQEPQQESLDPELDEQNASGLDGDMLPYDESVEGQDGEQSMPSSSQFQSGQEQTQSMGDNNRGWSDGSFTDAALDDNDFDAGFDVVQQE